MKAVGYVRVSTADQANGLSLESQQRAISSEVARRGWDLARVEEDHKSGKNTRRDGLERALAAVSILGGDGALVVARLDRLARSLADLCELMARADREGWTLLVLVPMVDLSDPFGRCMAQVAGAFAELERQIISQRQKESVAARRAAGTYRYSGPQASPAAVKRIAAMMQAGTGARAAARQLLIEGFAPPTGNEWHPRTVGRIMQRLRNDSPGG